jgi:hypothetical protein
MRNLVTGITLKGRDIFFEDMVNDVKILDINHLIYPCAGVDNLASCYFKAVENCPTKYYCVFDDDDRFPNEGALQDMLNHLETHNDVPYAFSVEHIINEDGLILKKGAHYTYDRKIHKNLPAYVHGLILIKKDLISNDVVEYASIGHKYTPHRLTYKLAEQGIPYMSKFTGRHWRKHKQGQLHRFNQNAEGTRL